MARRFLRGFTGSGGRWLLFGILGLILCHHPRRLRLSAPAFSIV
jgi:hypothetical protein